MSKYHKYVIDILKDEKDKNFTDEQKQKAIDELNKEVPIRNWASVQNKQHLRDHVGTHGINEDELYDLLAGDKYSDLGYNYIKDALTNWGKEHNSPAFIDKVLDKHWKDLDDSVKDISQMVDRSQLAEDADFAADREKRSSLLKKKRDAENAIHEISKHGSLSDKQIDKYIENDNASNVIRNKNIEPRHLLKIAEKNPQAINDVLRSDKLDTDTASKILENPEHIDKIDNFQLNSFISNNSEGYSGVDLKPKADEEQKFDLHPRAIHNILENHNNLSQNVVDALLDHADPSFKKKWIDDRLGISNGEHNDEDLVGTDDNWDNWSRNDFKPEWNRYESTLPTSRHLDDEHAEHIKRHGDFDHKYDLYHNEHIDPKHGAEMFQKWYDDDSHHGYDSGELNEKIKEHKDDLYGIDYLPEETVEEIRQQGYDNGYIDEAADQTYSIQDYIDQNEDKIIDRIIKDGHYDDDVMDLAHEKLREDYDDWESENPNSSQNEGDSTFDALNTLWELEQDGHIAKEDLKAQTGLEDWSELGLEADEDGDVHSSQIKDKLDEYGGPLKVNFADHEDLHISEHPEYEERLEGTLRDAVEEHFRENQWDYVDKMHLYEDHREDDSYREAFSAAENEYIEENAKEHINELYNNAHQDTRAIPAHLHAHIPNFEELHQENKKRLSDGPSRSWLDSQIKNRSYEHEYGDNLHHHEMVRDYAQTNGGKIDVGTMNKMYPNQKDIWKQIFDKKGALTSEDIENKISEIPKTKYDISYGKWDSSKMQNLNRRDQVIFRLDHSTDSIKPIMEDGDMYNTFRRVQDVSKQSGHPTNSNTIGWARVDTSDPKHWMIDEVQSDFGKTVQRYLKQEGAEHKADHIKKIQDFHKNWRENLTNAVLKEAKKHGAEKVSTHSPESKHSHAAYGSDKIHSVYKKSYKQVPRSMGFQPSSHEDLPLVDDAKEHFFKENPYKDQHRQNHKWAYNHHMNMWKAHEVLQGTNDIDTNTRHVINAKGHLETAQKHAERIKTLDPKFKEVDKNKVQPLKEHWDTARTVAADNDFAEHEHDKLLKEPTPEFKDAHNQGHTYNLNPQLIKKNMDEFLELYEALEKGDGFNAIKGGILALGLMHGAHYMGQDAKEEASNKLAENAPKHARSVASIEPEQSVQQQAYDKATKEANDIIYRNDKKYFIQDHADKLSPHVYKQTIKNNPELNERFGYINQLSNSAFKEVAQKNGNLRAAVHGAHYDKLHSEFDGDYDKIKHAWENGIKSTHNKFGRSPASVDQSKLGQQPSSDKIAAEDVKSAPEAPNFTHRRMFRSQR